MRILHISKYYYPFVGGVEQVAKDIVDSLKERGDIEQKVICFNDEKTSATEKNKDRLDKIDDIDVIRCGELFKISSQTLSKSYKKKLKEMMSNYKPDVVILHYPNPFVTHILSKYYDSKFKLIVYWHLDITKQKVLRLLFERQNKKLLDRADIIVATSPNYIEGSKWLKLYKNKCEVIPCCIRRERLKDTEISLKKEEILRKLYKGKVVCFSVGRHVPYKGYEYLIRASRQLDNKVVIIIAGQGPLTNKLKEMAKNCCNVEIVGRLSDEELTAYYKMCDIICFPSITKNEAFGIALAEGMSFGKPAITFTIPGSGVNYVNLKNITGCECDNRNEKAYADAIKKLASNKKIANIYGINAHKRIEDEFTYSAFKSKINNLISQI